MPLFDLRIWKQFRSSGGNRSEDSIIDEIAIDSRTVSSNRSLFVALPGKLFDGHHFLEEAAANGAHYALVKKGFSPSKKISKLTLLCVDDPLTAFQELAALYRQQQQAKVIAITGSYGKTVLKDLLFALLKSSFSIAASPESFNSQLGVPLALFTIQDDNDFALIEAGISHVGEMERLAQIISPDYAILTNIENAHYPTLPSLEITAREKATILTRVPPENWVLLPQSDYLSPFMATIPAKHLLWSAQSSDLPQVHCHPFHPQSPMEYSMSFPDGAIFHHTITKGLHYFSDLLNMTLKAAWLLGCKSEACMETLREYNFEPVHMEMWKAPNGATIINEKYCSHFLSIQKSLKFLSKAGRGHRRFFIFGGLRTQKNLHETYRQIGKTLAKARLDSLSLVGDLF